MLDALWIRTYFEYLSLFGLGLLVTYCVGRSILLAVGARAATAHQGVFHALLVGAIAQATLTALVSTRLRTNLAVGLIPAALMVVRLAPREPRSAPRLNLRQWAELAGYALVVYTGFAAVLITGAARQPLLTGLDLEDFGFYAVVSKMIQATGQENIYHVANLLDTAYHGTTPYHYLELWLAGGVSRVLQPIGALPVYLLGLVVLPMFGVTALLGSWCVMADVATVRWHHRLLAVPAFLASGVWPVSPSVESGVLGALTPLALDMNRFLLFAPKRVVLYSVLVACVDMWLRRDRLRGLALLILMTVVSPEGAPGIYIGILLFLFVEWRRGESARAIGQALAVVGISATALAGFYAAFGNRAVPAFDVMVVLRDLMSGRVLLSLLYAARAAALIPFLYAFHILLLCRFVGRRTASASSLVLGLTSLVAGGITAWSIFHGEAHSIQFLTGILAVCQTVVLMMAIPAFSASGIGRIAVCGYLAVSSTWNVLQTYGLAPKVPACVAAYYDQIASYRPRSPVGFSLQGEADFSGGKWWRRNVLTYTLGDAYLPFFPGYTKTVELNVLAVPEGSFRERPWISRLPALQEALHATDARRSALLKRSAPFYRYAEARMGQEPTPSSGGLMLDFLDEHDIDWGIISGSANPSRALLQRIVLRADLCTSGERFVVVAPPTQRRPAVEQAEPRLPAR